ncbi:MAG: GNAT family N-acetyltransferase [Gammaproteobacteria bacterium]|nr:GNAT family N-acetyltransferase [Gammaproteobacteria bacterium]
MTDDIMENGLLIGFPLEVWTPPARPPNEPMQGRYCRVERLHIDTHAADLFAANSLDTRHINWIYLPYGPFATLPDYCAWIESVCLSDDPLFHSIVDLATGRAVGVASYLNINLQNGTIEVGHINYSPALQNTRAATEAMYLMMKRAFELGYRRYEWKCNALNRKSRDAAQRLGFSYEGVFRQHMVTKSRNRDSAWYAAIDSEWPALQAAFETWLAPENFAADRQQREALSRLTAPLLVARHGIS